MPWQMSCARRDEEAVSTVDGALVKLAGLWTNETLDGYELVCVRDNEYNAFALNCSDIQQQ